MKKALCTILALVYLVACAARVAPGTSFEGTVAVYGKPVLDKLREAQKLIGDQGDKYPELRPQLKPAIEVTVKLFESAETLGLVLLEMDKTDVTAEKMKLAERAKALLDVVQVGLQDIYKNVDSQQARDLISSALHAVNVARVIANLYQVLAPLLPKPTPSELLDEATVLGGSHAYAY